MKPIHNEPGLFRDENGVILNKNDAEYAVILNKRRHEKELGAVNEEVNYLKNELADLKKIIKAIAK